MARPQKKAQEPAWRPAGFEARSERRQAADTAWAALQGALQTWGTPFSIADRILQQMRIDTLAGPVLKVWRVTGESEAFRMAIDDKAQPGTIEPEALLERTLEWVRR